MRQRHWIELFSGYDCEICYHPDKANVVADALSRKERVKPKSVRAMNMILQSSIKDRILAAQKEVPLKGEERTLIMDEAHKSKYSVHPGANKMYYDLRYRYWWLGMKKDIAEYEGIAMDFVTKLPSTSSGHDRIWVIVDRLTKSAYFLPMRKDYKMERLARLYLNEIIARHGVSILIISNRDSRFTSRFWQSMQEALGTRLDMRPELVRETTKKISEIKDRLKAARDRQKSYADKKKASRVWCRYREYDLAHLKLVFEFSIYRVWNMVDTVYPKSWIRNARIKATCLFLAYVVHKDFTVFQMDVKTAFLNGILKEKVRVVQHLGFVNNQYPDHVYALDKALYGLKQAPRAWYDVLSKFLIDSGFQKCSIDTTLFI
nr:reverse transcriptase domain-containing protein [Tanacetum cinerariifolium]